MEQHSEGIREVLKGFTLKGEPVSWRRFGSGHINGTYRVVCKEGETEHIYILQQINTEIFKNPEALMNNIIGVTEFLKEKIQQEQGDPDRETLTVLPTKDGKYFLKDSAGRCWRMYPFIRNAETFDQVNSAEDFERSAWAFGHFQRQLEDYPVEKLAETIPDFHNTPKRFETWMHAVQEDCCGRAALVQPEIQFLMEHQAQVSAAEDMHAAGKLPYRVTHNDTKLNNIMFDLETGAALCVIDLDTIMPGFAIFDYGDSIRFGANTALEDETDLSKVTLSLELFEAYTRGFLEGCEGSLTETEIEMLPMGAMLMTLESAIRFLTDYLQGDTYFRIDRPNQNLDRARTQIQLIKDMEKKWEQMQAIVKKLCAIS